MERKIGFETSFDETFLAQLKSKYKSKIFIGFFKEKRFCESLECYKDVILIDCKSEKEICEDLKGLLSEINEHSKGQIQCGVTEDNENYTIWTELEEGTPFGKYWFQIKTFKFRFNEIQIRLKKLRFIEDADYERFTKKLISVTKKDCDEDVEVDDAVKQWKLLFDFWRTELSAAVAWFLSISINRQSIIEVLRFISLLIVSLFAGSTQIVKYVGVFTIKLFERVTWLVHTLTPVALGLIDLSSKIIGGFYLLIAMIWKDSTGARRQQPSNNAITAGEKKQQQAIRYNNYD